MKKNRINAFTLVEMLIVIVIIGILIAALMPRMQAAQGRARDVSRKTALSQVQSAIVTSQGDNGKWPGQDNGCLTGCGLSTISGDLTRAGMNSIPVDPLKSKVTGIGTFPGNTGGDYGYIITTRNGSAKGGFALMAKTEVEGGSNWVVCSGTCTEAGGAQGCITGGTDIAKIQLCDKIELTGSTPGCYNNYRGTCRYTQDSQLRYLVTY